DRIYYQSYNSKAGVVSVPTIDRAERQIPKRSIFPWRKRKLSFRSFKAKGEPLLKKDVREEGGDDIDFDRRMFTSSNESSYGENTEVISRDGLMSLQTQVFFASIDQRSECASGESACTSLVATIATWFQNNHNQMPLKSEFDTLVREDGVFDFLDGAMSFDNIWDEISQNGSNSNHVYIVSCNDHFFILKVERDAYYIIDTLGERLYEGCNQAYVLKFDNDTTIQRLLVDSQKSNAKTKHSLVSKGKESCKEYIKSFLAAISLRELQADVKKGLMATSSPLVHRQLQIEFHYTKCLEVNTNIARFFHYWELLFILFLPMAANTNTLNVSQPNIPIFKENGLAETSVEDTRSRENQKRDAKAVFFIQQAVEESI
nr:hypothetical protein [Tanacetum cinerariifolium]